MLSLSVLLILVVIAAFVVGFFVMSFIFNQIKKYNARPSMTEDLWRQSEENRKSNENEQ